MIDLKKELSNVKTFDLSGYEEKEVLGVGAFGKATLCKKESTKIVIKQFFYKNNEPDLLEMIKREIINQSECNKANLIVPFLGISFEDLHKQPLQIPLLIIGYEEGGSLTILNKNSIDDVQKMIIIYGIAKGVQFLHHVPICHRDLNPNNILLDSNKYPLICDFGTSRQFSQVHLIYATQRGTANYMSPEMLSENGMISEYLLPSDIFSFATVIYNLLTNINPYDNDIEKKRINFLCYIEIFEQWK